MYESFAQHDLSSNDLLNVTSYAYCDEHYASFLPEWLFEYIFEISDLDVLISSTFQQFLMVQDVYEGIKSRNWQWLCNIVDWSLLLLRTSVSPPLGDFGEREAWGQVGHTNNERMWSIYQFSSEERKVNIGSTIRVTMRWCNNVCSKLT